MDNCDAAGLLSTVRSQIDRSTGEYKRSGQERASSGRTCQLNSCDSRQGRWLSFRLCMRSITNFKLEFAREIRIRYRWLSALIRIIREYRSHKCRWLCFSNIRALNRALKDLLLTRIANIFSQRASGAHVSEIIASRERGEISHAPRGGSAILFRVRIYAACIEISLYLLMVFVSVAINISVDI